MRFEYVEVFFIFSVFQDQLDHFKNITLGASTDATVPYLLQPIAQPVPEPMGQKDLILGSVYKLCGVNGTVILYCVPNAKCPTLTHKALRHLFSIFPDLLDHMPSSIPFPMRKCQQMKQTECVNTTFRVLLLRCEGERLSSDSGICKNHLGALNDAL